MPVRRRAQSAAIRLLALTLLAGAFAPVSASAAGAEPPPGAPFQFYCGTPDPPPEPPGLLLEGNLGDCSISNTNPSEEYEPAELLEIPVAFHVITRSDGYGNVPDTLIESQIDVLNEDYQALLGTPGEDGSNIQLRFHLADLDPAGNPTTGITRTADDFWFLDQGSYFDTLAWNPHRYLNIYSLQLYDGPAGKLAGYVPYLPASNGGAGVGSTADRVVLTWDVVGRPAPTSYPALRDGRTGTHEVGHYLGLFHVFQAINQCPAADPPGCYQTGDLVCDTAVDQIYHYDCPAAAESCGSPDPIHNYMEYSSCRTEFTPEQGRRIRCTLANYRPQLPVPTGDPGGTCQTAPPPGVPPQVPTAVVALPAVGEGTLIDVSWQDNSCVEDGFEVLRLHPPDTAWRSAGFAAKDQTTFRDDTRELPTPAEGVGYYFYKVRAYNDDGDATSDRDEARLYAEGPGTADTLRPRGCIEELAPLLSWHGGGRSSQYYVRLIDAFTGEPAMPDATPSETSVAVPAPLAPEAPYMLRVWGMNNIGWGGGSGPEFFMPFCGEFSPPSIEAPPPGCIDTLTPEIRWTPVDGALSYHLRLFEVIDIGSDPEVIPGGVGITGGTSWTVPAGLLQPGQEYRVKVKPHTGGDEVGYSPHRFFVPFCTPETLGTSSPIAPSGGTVPTGVPTYRWEPAAQAEGYALEVWTPDWQQQVGVTYPAAAICDASECEAQPAVWLADGPYHWRVQGTRGADVGLWSPWASFSVLDDSLPVLDVADVTQAEGDSLVSTLTLTVQRTGPPDTDAEVRLTAADCTAEDGLDYLKPASGVLELPVGVSSATVDVPVLGDSGFEGDEVFVVTLSEAVGATIGDGWAQGRIRNDDPRGPYDPPRLPQRADFDRNGRGDLLWRHRVSGVLSVWLMDGSDRSSGTLVESADFPGLAWEVVGTADFDRDGDTDLLWRNQVSRNLALWTMDGTAHTGGVLFNGRRDPAWRAQGTADLDRDGWPDLLWRHAVTGELSAWLMTGTSVDAEVSLSPSSEPDLDWQIEALGDLDADGWQDLVWRNAASGALRVWLLDGTDLRQEVPLTTTSVPPPSWRVAGAWDVDDDGATDLVWQNDTSGRLVVWYLDGTTRRCGGFLNPDAPVDPAWRVVGPR